MVTRLIPKWWKRYKDDCFDYWYNPEEFEILLDEYGIARCHYYSLELKPSQPYGLYDYSFLFAGCKGESLDLSDWDFSGVESLSHTFCKNRFLKSVDLPRWNFDSIECTDYAFSECSSLETFELRSIRWNSLKSMDGMFYDCSNLRELKLNDWYLPKVESMFDFCYWCNSLSLFDVSGWIYPSEFKTMLKKCKHLVSGCECIIR